MFKSISRTRLVVIGSLIALATTGCGASKVTQCSSFDKVVKDGKTVNDKLAKELETIKPGTEEGFQLIRKMGAKNQEFSKTIRAVALQDEKLKGFQSRLAATYETYSKLSPGMESAVKAKDLQSFNKVSAQADAAAADEKALAKEVAKYCAD